MRTLLGTFTLAATLCAQSQTPLPTTASISGILRDQGTGKPLARYNVTAFPTVNAASVIAAQPAKTADDVSDDAGHYHLNGLLPGSYRITVRSGKAPGTVLGSKSIALSGHDIDGLNIDVMVPGTISGRVLDENKEPVAGITVLVISREYYLGQPGYFFKSGAGRTNDRGEFTTRGLQPGRPYLLLADQRGGNIPARAETPLNPKLRRKVPMRTWYLNSPDVAGAVPIVLNSGESRENVDIQVKKASNYCAEGTMSIAGAPAALNFEWEALHPSSGVSANMGMFVTGTSGKTAADGKFRICDLYPGDYRVNIFNGYRGSAALALGVLNFSIGDQDVRDLQAVALTGFPVEGEVVYDGPPPNQPVDAKVSISPQPLLRAFFSGELPNSANSSIPGTFTLPTMFPDDYTLRVTTSAPGLYIKDVSFGGESVMYAPLRLSGAAGKSTLRVIVGQDGGTIAATVVGRDSQPVADTHVVIVPADVLSEGIAAVRMINGSTDQNGQFTTPTIAPGKYYVAATDETFDATVASISRLWLARVRFTEVTLAPSGQASVSLQVIQIDR